MDVLLSDDMGSETLEDESSLPMIQKLRRARSDPSVRGKFTAFDDGL
jgi:hypothetical protein